MSKILMKFEWVIPKGGVKCRWGKLSAIHDQYIADDINSTR